MVLHGTQCHPSPTTALCARDAENSFIVGRASGSNGRPVKRAPSCPTPTPQQATRTMPRISVIPLSPSERRHLLLCELDDAMFVVDCGWPTDARDDAHPTDGKVRAPPSTLVDPRQALSSVNWARVDFILISNYEQMTLLPYITEYTEFTGPVLATEPTKAYGRCVLEEALWMAEAGNQQFAADSSHGGAGTGSSSSSSAGDAVRGEDGWRVRALPFTQQDIVAAMERVTDVRHNEIITPVPFVQVYTRSSGYCIGGANWTVECKGHRTAFISMSALAAGLHPQEWDGSVVAEAHVVVFCDAVDPADSDESDTGGSMAPNILVSQRINQLCSTAMATLKQRSRVLLVGEPYGVTQDILQLVAENAISLGLPLPQFVVVSPVAERTLQYGNIMGEWLCAAKQALLYLPEYPFADKDLRQKGHLHFVRSLSELATRSIPQGTWFVVVSPQDIATINHFVRQWQRDAGHCSGAEKAAGSGAARFAVLIHDDDVARAQALVNGTAASSEVTYVPVSRRLTHQAIRQVLAGAAHAQHVLVPSHIHARLAPALTGDAEYALLEHSYLQATVVDLDTDRHLPLNVQRGMAQRLKRAGKQRAVVSGMLSLAAGKIRLVCADGSGEDGPAGGVSRGAVAQCPVPAAPATGLSLRGWTPARLASELCDAGLSATVVGDGGTSAQQQLVRVSVPGGAATIRVRSGGWAVDCTSASAQWAVTDALRRLTGSSE
ncbi:Integrator complex subunit 9 [Coemansia biformis]|uniref:Integrator complex subunit 9 n=1 Tax=Coemansia biformis TaxID=1286918 RepID=A0A9W7YIK9_9FUNG|nr:Integrator complex subunit 9 [Coemansia biformis]